MEPLFYMFITIVQLGIIAYILDCEDEENDAQLEEQNEKR
tara:strand:+ start:287 stop:406 length:120 start_codon:yes stop_codon:yes gene_type:complete